MTYGQSKDLAKRTQPDKILRDKAFKITSGPKYDGYQRGLASMVYFTSFLIKNLVEVVLLRPNQIISLQINFTSRLSENLKKRKVYSLFRDNIW